MRLSFPGLSFKRLGLLCVLFVPAVRCFSLDRESFSITRYELAAQVDPEQHRLAVRGTVTLRNDAQVPQKIAVLQVSSSLEWRSLRAGEKIVQFVRQPYASDIDHTGALSEAVVTLPQEIAPGTTIELNIAYEGLILADATRLTRIGTPEDAAKNTDWDQISSSFSAVRGAGYVAWYPIATEVANLSEGDSLFATLARWKRRERGASMELTIENPALVEDQTPLLLVCTGKGSQGDSKQGNSGRCSYDDIAQTPSFALANYSVIDRPSITVFNLPGHDVAAEAYGAAAEKTAPLIAEWFGPSRRKTRIADLPDSQSAPFESGPFLFAPLTNTDSLRAGLAVAHQLAHGSLDSPRPWISEGLAHFAQALYMEREKGRPAALDYMALHRSLLSEAENPSSRQPADESRSSLVATADEEFYRSKAIYVWWMLRDLVGDDALKRALAAYRPAEDNDASYMPRLISAQTQRDLGWFFDNWVYRDVGLPEFKVESAFARKVGENEFIVTVTIDNLGGAGAEVPLIVKSARGAVTRRLEVRAKSKAVLRIGTPEAPQEVVVNDGSVPESNVTNNAFKVVMSDLGK